MQFFLRKNSFIKIIKKSNFLLLFLSYAQNLILEDFKVKYLTFNLFFLLTYFFFYQKSFGKKLGHVKYLCSQENLRNIFRIIFQ